MSDLSTISSYADLRQDRGPSVVLLVTQTVTSTPAPAPATFAPATARTGKPNRYGGKCLHCGVWIDAEAGLLGPRVDGKWTVQHSVCPEVPEVAEEAPQPQPQPQRQRRNKYAQKCDLCGRQVPEEAGLLEKNDEGKWVVYHDGPCQTDFPFPEGRYAITHEGEVRFYHCHEGQVYVMASDNEILVQSHAAEAIVAKIAEDSLAAAKLYGVEFERCGVCNRGLTSDWRKVGIGPKCAEKGWG